MSETKSVHIGDILSVTTGRLVSPRHFHGLQQFLEWLAGEPVWTHQCIRVSEEANPWLREWFPDLATVEPPEDLGPDNWEAWLQSVADEHGSHRDVPRLPESDHASIDPLLELQLVGADKVIPVVVGGDEQ